MLRGPCEIAVGVPSASDIVEVHQRPYCPQHCAPIRWLASDLVGDHDELAARAASAATELHFHGSQEGAGDAEEAESVAQLATALVTEADDYCGGLSGGQRVYFILYTLYFILYTTAAGSQEGSARSSS